MTSRADEDAWSRAGGRIAIVDDCFPYSVSGFRMAEYPYLLRRFPESRVVSSLAVLNWLDHETSAQEVKDGFAAAEPDLAQRTFYSEDGSFLDGPCSDQFEDAQLLYSVFLNNAIDLIPIAERFDLPFAFTLYPGGGFQVRDQASNEKLDRVMTHPLFSGVIVTQPLSLRLVQGRYPSVAKSGKMTYVFGGVLQDTNQDRPDPVRVPSSQNDEIHICFIANRYEPRGLDKGLDIFVSCVERLVRSRHAARLRFHSVGPWVSTDFGDVAGSIQTHGQLANRELPKLLAKMDIGLFPTRGGVLGSGSFDGFPVGAAVECAKSGVAVVTTNPVKQKTPLRPGVSYVEIRPNAGSATRALLRLIEEPDSLTRLKAEGQEDFQKVYSLSNQMEPRASFLRKLSGHSNP